MIKKRYIGILFLLILMISFQHTFAQDDSANLTDIQTDKTPYETIELENDDLLSTNNSKKDIDIAFYVPDEVLIYDDSDLPIISIEDDDFKGTIMTYVDDKGTALPSYEKFITIKADNLSLGLHNITVTYPGDETYNSLNVTKTMNVVNVKINMPDEYSVKDNVGIQASFLNDATGTITILSDNVKIKTIDVSKINARKLKKQIGEALNLNYGTHQIEVRYSGDKNYKSITKKVTTTVSFEIKMPSTVVGFDDNLNICVPKNINVSRLIVEIDGIETQIDKTSSDPNDKETIICSLAQLNTTLGRHNISVRYLGDNVYPQQVFNSKFKSDIRIPIQITYDEQMNITLRLPSDAKGNFTLTVTQNPSTQPIDVYNESRELVNGSATIRLPYLTIGNYECNFYYTGDDYKTTFSRQYFYVCPKVEVAPEVMTYGEDKYIIISGDVNSTVSVGIQTSNSEMKFKKSGTLTNGSLKISLKEMPVGTTLLEYTISTDSSIYEFHTSPITVKGLQCKLVGGKDITMYYEGGNTYSLKVWGDYGKVVGAYEEVKVKIGKKSYVIQTDKNGVAKLKIEQLPGKYTITATYHNAKVTNKLVVKSMISLYNVKVKKSAKKIILKAKLAKKLKGKTITFKFNGQKLKTKTNAQGIAKVTVSKKLLNKLKVGKTVTYTATYVSQTVKKTAKVIK